MSYPKLNFTGFSSPHAAEFPFCCASGFLMVYNTHLRDPVKAYRETVTPSSFTTLLRKELAAYRKKKRNKSR